MCVLQGIGSRLMASMGYVVGSGLGRRGEGRLEPVEALLYPPGKSLGKCNLNIVFYHRVKRTHNIKVFT